MRTIGWLNAEHERFNEKLVGDANSLIIIIIIILIIIIIIIIISSVTGNANVLQLLACFD